MNDKLQLTVAKLELKHMELVDKLTNFKNNYIIRLITSTVSDKIVLLNGDWVNLTGFSEDVSSGLEWDDIVPDYELGKVMSCIDDVKKGLKNTFVCDIITSHGKTINVKWYGKYLSDINSLVFIGEVGK
jgi:hypothetical protein